VPASPGISHDWHLQERLAALQVTLNSGHYLRLFVNNFVPAPGDDKTKFTETAFAGYAPASLNSDFGTPQQIGPGNWQISGTSHQWTVTTGTAGPLYGWYLTDPAGNVRFSFLFAASITISAGSSLYVQPLIQDWSYSVVP
jgi:hypothetical protein